MLPNAHLTIFVATRAIDVPAGPTISVDGSVPGAALRWDHHVSGEVINLDAMPPAIDASGFVAVGTTMPDTDALASVVAVLFGGASALPSSALEILRAASHRCDHLRPLPGTSEQVDQAGLALHRWVSVSLAFAEHDQRNAVFAALCRGVAEAIRRGEDLPGAGDARDAELVRFLRDLGRLREDRGVVVVDLRGLPRILRPPPDAVYMEVPGCPLGVIVEDHPASGPRYTVGVNTASATPPSDLGTLLVTLARREHAHGPPCAGPEPVPGNENWGGRATVFGSPWNHGSRLDADEVIEVMASWLRSDQ